MYRRNIGNYLLDIRSRQIFRVKLDKSYMTYTVQGNRFFYGKIKKNNFKIS